MRPSILLFEIFAVLQAISVNVMSCSPVSQFDFEMYYIITSVVFTLIIMVFSAIMMKKLSGMMTFGFLKRRIRWLWYLEIFIQIMLVGRLVILSIKYIESTLVYTVTFCIILVVTELVPFTFIVINIVQRLLMYRKTQQMQAATSKRFSSTNYNNFGGCNEKLRLSSNGL